ncbi:MAG TPA: uroporphyrinogen-III synthase [Gemmatimonadaceae bacterium]|nr:uroporphyrinogen-III synthase [Gemmatimonadaceae bacterium]
MSRSLHGITVAHFEARHEAELNGLIARHGGVPRAAPALSETPIAAGEKELAVFDGLASGAFDVVVLLTGGGTRRLFEEAARAWRLGAVMSALRRVTVVARGPKPVPVLREHQLRATHVAPAPHTSSELLATLETIPVAGRRVLVVNAGEPLEEPSGSLRVRGADVVELQLYAWTLLPTDAGRIDELIREIVAARIDAVLFTTQVQVRHVFEVAARRGMREALLSALREHVLIGAVGPTVAHALAQLGLDADVVPDHPKMGQLVVALADHVTTRAPREARKAEPIVDYVQAVLSGRGGF